MSDVKFYESVSTDIQESSKYRSLKKLLRNETKKHDGTIYVIQYPLYNLTGDNLEDNDGIDLEAFAILIPDTKIIFTSLNNIKDDSFYEYVESFIDSVITLSRIFKFNSKVGNSRKWRPLIEEGLEVSDINEQTINSLTVTTKSENSYILEILISLITGSINTPEKGGASSDLLEAVKKRIVQFDGDQTRFVYDDLKEAQITIQGLAGTGKTELLFHRLVNLYTQTNETIVFTCHSKVLANDIKNRLPKFLDQMRVLERSDIDERVKVMSSWGSSYSSSNQGLYSYICSHYDIEFINYRDSGKDGFEGVCRCAIEQLNNIENFEPFIGYILIDEAQDFSSSFFELCSLVCKKQVIIASDIFQSIFNSSSETVQKPHFTLNKVYRTDPRNFMFSQFLGFGLKERPVINWLTDDAWKISGYTVNKDFSKQPTTYEFSREPLNRFNDFNENEIVPTKLTCVEDINEILDNVKKTMVEIRRNYPNVTPSDIGIVFLSKNKVGYQLADMISSMIIQDFEWETQKIYESRYRSRSKNKVFISNQNNVKGLEFSFLIGIVIDKITDNIEIRNTLYMMMTRSFITSYLILNKNNEEIYEKYSPLLDEILETGKARIEEPREDERYKTEELKRLMSGSLTFEQKIDTALDNKGLSKTGNQEIIKQLTLTLKDKLASVSEIEEIIDKNRDYLK